MPSTDGQMPRKLLPIIYVLDTSGSMSGDRISSVNEAMKETVDVLKDVSKKNPTAELKIGVLKFASGAEWVTKNAGEPGLVFMEDFFWNDLSAGGLTDLGSALNELNDKLSRKQFLDSDVGFKAPVLIFMSDGGPTDDWEKAFDKVKNENKWFKVSTKIAIAVDDADASVLTKIADGNAEAVIKVDDNEKLKKLIRVVSVTASMIGSQSKTGEGSQQEIVDKVKEEIPGGEYITVEPPKPTPIEPEEDPWDWDEDGW